MNYLTSENFSFESTAVKKDTFGVVKFSGSDGLSLLYHFDIMLVADDPDIDMVAVLREQVTFFIHRPDGTKIPFHGILAEFDIVGQVGDFYLYRALQVPKLWRLTLTNHNQIFLGKDTKTIIRSVLEDGGLTSLDFDFRLQADYQSWEYVCQYRESHYNFIARWLERTGMYYFFDQSGSTEKLVITDTKMAHDVSAHGSNVTYTPVSGMEAFHLDEAVQVFTCRRTTVPQKVLVKDYNYRKPLLEVSGQAAISENGHGETYYYGDHFRTPEEGSKLARIRSEEQLCKAEQFHGESTVPYLQPGYTFQLADHFRRDMNRSYLTIAVTHYGNQVSALIGGLREQLADNEQEFIYRNTFSAIGDDVQFRSERATELPRLYGTINARIDAYGSGKYAELDDKGRYKVILPFDRSGRKGGKASAWFRMMQPYGGADHGMHFPLHKGTEVLLTFIDGDPDRPVIAGAVANPENPSQVTSADQTMAKLTTAGGNKIHIEDKEGSERILFQTPGAKTWVRMGMPNDPDDGFAPRGSKPATGNSNSDGSAPSGFAPPDPKPDPKPKPKPKPDDFGDKFHKETEKEEGYHISTKGWFVGKYGAGKLEVIGPLKQEILWGNELKVGMGFKEEFFLGIANYEANLSIVGGHFHLFKKEFHVQKITIGEEDVHIHGNGIKIIGDNTTVHGNKTKVAGTVDTVTGGHTSIKGNVTTLQGNVDEVSGTVGTVSGETTTISGDVTTVSGNVQGVTGETSTISGTVTTVSGNVQTVTGETREISGEVTTIFGDVNQISGENAIITQESITL